jgi:hypothetical protein
VSALTKTALTAAVTLSVLSVTDAAIRGVGATPAPWDPEVAAGWVTVGVAALEVVTFASLAAVLTALGEPIDRGSRGRRWVRRALAADLAVLAVGIAASVRVDAEVLGIVASVAFLGMFLLGVVLGATLLRRPGWRTAAALMIAPLALIPLTFLLEAVARGWGHPGYAETALYLGIALVGRCAEHAGPGVRATPAVASRV